jgi:hypothetical protein
VIVQEEMYSFDVLHLEAINWLSLVFLWSQKLPDLGDSEEASQPVPLIIVANKQANVAIRALERVSIVEMVMKLGYSYLITRATEHNAA